MQKSLPGKPGRKLPASYLWITWIHNKVALTTKRTIPQLRDGSSFYALDLHDFEIAVMVNDLVVDQSEGIAPVRHISPAGCGAPIDVAGGSCPG